jgi:simple sugar transport system substrate-binding protein
MVAASWVLSAGSCSDETKDTECEEDKDTQNANDSDSDSTPTPNAEGRCKGSRFVYFAGGAADDTFARILSNGAMAAGEDLGATVEFINSDWVSNNMPDQLEEVIKTNPTGLALLGHPLMWADPPFNTKWATLIDEARAKGILVTSQNVAMAEKETMYRADGFGFVGSENYASGQAVAKEAVIKFALKAGDQAWVWGPSRALEGEEKGRTDGMIDALEELGLVVDYTKIEDAESQDPTQGASVVAAYLSENPDVKLIAADSGPLTEHMKTFLSGAGKTADDIAVIGFDLSPKTAEEIKEGWVDLVQDQQPYLQGYLPILQLCLSKLYNFGGLHIDTGAGFINKDNVDAVIPLTNQFIR